MHLFSSKKSLSLLVLTIVCLCSIFMIDQIDAQRRRPRNYNNMTPYSISGQNGQRPRNQNTVGSSGGGFFNNIRDRMSRIGRRGRR